MSLEDMTNSVREKVSGASLSATVKFDMGDTGVIRLIGGNPPEVDNDDDAADCTIKVAQSDLQDILDGAQDAQTAFMMGKLQVEGDMGAAMQLAGAL
ncbi:hypothetical protein CCR85_03795 [Rhodothalassium salexigens]|uniref:SCP2 sterol-binding domain-containing protein n=1 Tax=Rhodothalassium salexigens TaxID=1086 RepID=UPI00191235B4|nr:SCP2 sterol-binding domain-containing protein [Rhodothalassium salexigens]MBK5910615.1 hypothetical protein [Rhodothalassium salexigens]MBK5920089.1 hypothetical protein [Rhodothalassium salexigens]